MSILSGAQSLTEWLSPFGGLIIGCGEASALVVTHIVKGEPISTSELTQTIANAMNAGQHSGISQLPSNVQWDLQQQGIQSHVVYNPGSSFQSLVSQALAGGKPVIVNVLQGSKLTSEYQNVGGHYVTIVGTQNGQYVTADPNAAIAQSGGFTYNTPQQFTNAGIANVIIPDTGTASGVSTTELGSNGLGGIAADIGQGVGAGLASFAGTVTTSFLKTFGLNPSSMTLP